MNLSDRDGFVLDIDVSANTTITHHIDAALHPKISIVARLHANASLFILIIGDVVTHSAPWRQSDLNQVISKLLDAAE